MKRKDYGELNTITMAYNKNETPEDKAKRQQNMNEDQKRADDKKNAEEN